MARITIYKNSILASICSIFGYLLVIGGIMVAFGGEIFGGILVALMGFGLAVLASFISERKKAKTVLKKIKASGLEPQIRQNLQAAIQVYNACPGKPALEYIRSLNPSAAAYIEQQLAAKKKK